VNWRTRSHGRVPFTRPQASLARVSQRQGREHRNLGGDRPNFRAAFLSTGMRPRSGRSLQVGFSTGLRSSTGIFEPHSFGASVTEQGMACAARRLRTRLRPCKHRDEVSLSVHDGHHQRNEIARPEWRPTTSTLRGSCAMPGHAPLPNSSSREPRHWADALGEPAHELSPGQANLALRFSERAVNDQRRRVSSSTPAPTRSRAGSPAPSSPDKRRSGRR
jgi:hypothetical protein